MNVHLTLKIPATLLAVLDRVLQFVFGFCCHGVDVVWIDEVLVQTIVRYPTVSGLLRRIDISPGGVVSSDLRDDIPADFLAINEVNGIRVCHTIGSYRSVRISCNPLILDGRVGSGGVISFRNGQHVLADDVSQRNFKLSKVQAYILGNFLYRLWPVLGVDGWGIVGQCLIGRLKFA